MRKSSVMIAACAMLSCAGVAVATPTAQTRCDNARMIAWKAYVSCVHTQVAKQYLQANGLDLQKEWRAFAKCRHSYFKKWEKFQPKATLADSTCVGSRFTDNGNTATDNLTGLTWEKKTALNAGTNYSDPHDADNVYSWTTCDNSTCEEDGTVFSDFLAQLYTTGFAGTYGWRLPTLAELQTIVQDFPCTTASCSCQSSPCIDPVFGPTQAFVYLTATRYAGFPISSHSVWVVEFIMTSGFNFIAGGSGANFHARAVRGGLH